jgi:hypothetical protein
MQIGIVGTGRVGQALAQGFTAAGHEVVVGSRTPAETDGEFGSGTRVASQAEAAEFGEVVVLALPARAIADVAADLADELAGKPVVDPANDFPTQTFDRPVAERVATAAPEAHVVKAFNTVGDNLMTDPVVGGQPATMLVAGDGEQARGTVAELASDLGFDAFVVGDLSNAVHLESLARFWISLSRDHGRDIAFRLLRE